MTSRMFYKIAAFLAVYVIVPFPAFAGEETFEGLKITTDNSGYITSISVGDPDSYLKTEAEYLFSVSPDGTPKSCTITFKDNVKRPMKHSEVELHFKQCGGPNAVWDYYSQHGKTVSYPPENDKLPPEAYGKVSRIICVDGSRFIGRLAQWANKPEGFSLTMEGTSGGPIPFFNGKVKEIQQMK
ncbi:MAG TPA: hypothetical protein VKF42_11165 [Chitinivibrionales bacterium]|nr:hypothetical protein [Chitinivibrionales bacterium]